MENGINKWMQKDGWNGKKILKGWKMELIKGINYIFIIIITYIIFY